MATVLCPTAADIAEIIRKLEVMEASLGSVGSTEIAWLRTLAPGDIVDPTDADRYCEAASIAGVSPRYRADGPAVNQHLRGRGTC